ncbi:hypothetical protein B0H17DRAFT_1081556, partial [Mycena rosella]
IAPLLASPVLHSSLNLLYLKNGLRRPRPVLVQLGACSALPRPPPTPRLGHLEHKTPHRLARGAVRPTASPHTAEAAPRTAPVRPRIGPPRAPLRSVRRRSRRLHLAEHPAAVPRAPAHAAHAARRRRPLPFTFTLHCIYVRTRPRTTNQGPPPRPLLLRRLPALRIHIHHPAVHARHAPRAAAPAPPVAGAPTSFHARHYPTPDARARLLARTLLNRIHAVGRPRSPYASLSSPYARSASPYVGGGGRLCNGYESESGARGYVPSRLSECVAAC